MAKRRNYNYTENDMEQALSAVKGGMKVREAARCFGVPKTTLLYRNIGKYVSGRRSGRQTVLTKDEEKLLSDWVIHMGDHGFPITKLQLLDSVQKLLNEANRATIFTNNRPGRDWFDRFMKRHPKISERVYQNLTKARASVS